METDSSATGGKGDTVSTREVGKKQVEEARVTGEDSPPPKRQRTNNEEDVEEEPLLEKVALYGEPNEGKVGFMVKYDGPSSFDFS